MITLYQPPPAWGLPSVSPFCVKLETYLRMAKLEYKTAVSNPMRAPNGRVPYVDIDGARMGDSSLIIKYLKSHYGDPLDGKLTREERNHALLLQGIVENHLYFAAAWLRWSDEVSWNYVRDYFKHLVPPFIGGAILHLVRRNALKTIRVQGVGEHTREQIIEFAKSDLTAISELLGDKSFFLGEGATGIDAVMFGFLIQILWIPWESPIKDHGTSLKNLTAFCERMKQKYWS